MIKAKALKIIEVFNTEDILTLDQLANRTDLKKHDIRQMIDRINNSSDLLGCRIEVIRTRGYKLLVLDKHKFIMGLKEMSLRIKRLPLKVRVAMRLMNSNEVCKYKELEEEFFISRSKVDSLIFKINNELSEYQVKVINEKYKGFSLLGDERMIRKYLIENHLYYGDVTEILEVNSFEASYLNLALAVQRSRIQSGHGLNSNTFSLVENTISESKELGVKGFSYAEQKYAQDIYRMTELKANDLFVESIIYLIKSELKDFYIDQISHSELARICEMIKYCYYNNSIPVNVYGVENSYFSEYLVIKVLQANGIELEDKQKIKKLSQLATRFCNYTLEMAYSTKKVAPEKIAIVNTLDKLALNQIIHKIQRILPSVKITVCNPTELSEEYDFILVFEMLKPKYFKKLDPSKVINISWRGRISSEEEILSHINTNHLTQFIRKHLLIRDEYIRVDQDNKYEYKHFKIEYDNNLNNKFIYIPTEERIIIATNFIDSSFEGMYMVDSFVKKMVSMNNSMLNKKEITVEDIVNLIRKI